MGAPVTAAEKVRKCKQIRMRMIESPDWAAMTDDARAAALAIVDPRIARLEREAQKEQAIQ